MFGFDLDYGDCTFDNRWFHVTRFPTYCTSNAILGHISSLAEIYRSSRSCMLTPTYGMHTETMTCSLFYHDPSVEPLLSHPVRLVFFSICMSSCFLFREMFPWCLGSIWITKITHLTMNDFMSLGFRPTIYSMPYWGIFSFRLRFINLHGVACSFPLTRYTLRQWHVCYLITIS